VYLPLEGLMSIKSIIFDMKSSMRSLSGSWTRLLHDFYFLVRVILKSHAAISFRFIFLSGRLIRKF
jgi:hypothetical protein